LTATVGTEAVDLDDETELGPEQIGGIGPDRNVCPGRWDPVPRADAKRPALSLAAGVVGLGLAEVETEELRLARRLAMKPRGVTRSRSASVRAGLVTGIPLSWVIVEPGTEGERWMRMPSRFRRPDVVGTVTSIGPIIGFNICQS
jgi:hypothetical protein